MAKVNVEHTSDLKIDKTVDLKKIKKLLILQYLPFGDVLLATSYTETLKKIFNPEIHYLAAKPFNQLIEGHPFIDKVISFEKSKGIKYFLNRIRLFIKIRKEKYDLIIDQLGNPSCKQMVLFSGAKYKLGWANRRFSFVLNIKANPIYKGYGSTHHFDILSPLGIKPQRYRMYIGIPDAAKERVMGWLRENNLQNKENVIAIAPSSKDEKKKWNIDLFKELTSRVIGSLKKKVVLIYAPNELEDALKIYNGLQSPDLFLAPKLSIKESAALLEQVQMLISDDSAIHHMSVATGTPSIAIFGRSNPESWSAQDEFPFHYHLKNYDWIPNPENDFGITVEDVLEKIKILLAELEEKGLSEDRFYCISKYCLDSDNTH